MRIQDAETPAGTRVRLQIPYVLYVIERNSYASIVRLPDIYGSSGASCSIVTHVLVMPKHLQLRTVRGGNIEID